jgi:hypothetical protein
VKPFKMTLHLSSKNCSMFAVCKILGTSIRRIWNHINLKIAFVYLLGESVTYGAGSQNEKDPLPGIEPRQPGDRKEY